MSVGLDIGSKTIKVVELAKEGEKFRLKTAGVVGYGGAEVEHMQKDQDMVPLVELLKKLFKDAKVESKKVSIALPEPQVFTRSIRFPLLTNQEIASAVKWEAEQYIPIPIDEAIIQHQIIERREQATPPSVIVLLVAAPRALVEKYVKVLSLAGMSAVAAETELMALVRALAPETQTAMIVDFGARSTDIAIAKNGNLAFSRSIPTAGEAFTRAIAKTLGVTTKQAEEYKTTYGLSSQQLEGKVGQALSPIFSIVAEEIKKAISFYQSEEKGEMPGSLILSGGTSGLPEAVSFLAKRVGIEVIIGNPFAKINIDPEVAKKIASYAPLYPIAVGLALGGE